MPESNLTYKQNMSKTQVYHVMGGIGIPLGAFCLALLTISSFANYGTRLICPLVGFMWVAGFLVALLMPSMRKEVINQTMMTIVSYCFALLGFKIMLGLTSGVSPEMISASFNQPIPSATGNALPGYIQNVMWLTTGMVPIGFIGMQGKRLLQFKHNQALQKQLGRARGYRNSGREHTTPR